MGSAGAQSAEGKEVMSDTSLEFPRDDWVTTLVQQSLAEDVGSGDVSTNLTVASGVEAEGRFVARQPGVVAGLPILEILFGSLSFEVTIDYEAGDGDQVVADAVVARVSGPARALLTGERAALNFLQHLSGIATLTSRYVAAVAGTECMVLDTRKTLPGYRALAKYAVRAGGGHNHRLGLYDRIMLKDNHWIATARSMPELVTQARHDHPQLAIEIEVDSLEQLTRILPLQVEWVLLDNFTLALIRQAVDLRNSVDPQHRTRLEASGNLDLANVREYALAGVDAVSIGRLTHSAPALDLAMDLDFLASGKKGRAD